MVERREVEVRDAIKRAKKIQDELEVEVPWQIFAGLKVPTGKNESEKPKEQEKEEED